MKTKKRISSYPPEWLHLVDTLIPSYVKETYSPKPAWRLKPFSEVDTSFFSQSILALSALFTEDRPHKVPAYFQHARYRSAYMLYFLPLSAAKFLNLFRLHEAALASLLPLKHITILDLGSGPATASLTLLIFLARLDHKPELTIHLVDTNAHIMRDGEALLNRFAEHLGIKLTVHRHASTFWEAPLPEKIDFTILGNLLNEADAPRAKQAPFWQDLYKRSQHAGILFVEPAARSSSQKLGSLRDSFLETHIKSDNPATIWGPCLHAGKCPLATGRDWCHFSFPSHIDGKLFKKFSQKLGSERTWVKYSYLWLASPHTPALKINNPDIRLVVSDRLTDDQSVLICEPKTARKIIHATARRGTVISLKGVIE